ncbi:methylated-DNA--[protein]-cysteine S-methyltransferase [Arcobacter sp. L]|uniref:methylated-DNA--[protein]-cysteine S-methyltransferase n=2 Tax=unclassified Arcobacter TaxID=2593671 RepID=UPI0002296383|nr:methylated-DNA--[protein]-cysteine S-methyltransferase [Arcobacter sp. L]BAK74133.1 putative methylated-DNA-protein-cysteine methyltransferase [Arcobacter sp. L]
MRKYNFETKEVIVTTTFSTPLGEMFAAASKKGIVILSSFTPFHIEAKIEVLKNTLNADVIPGNCEAFEILKIQLNEYLNKQRKTFEIPLQLVGSPFQIKVWKELLNIPYGKTISCDEIAKKLEDEKLSKAVSNATLQNMIDILVPSFRVILDEVKFSIDEKNNFLLKLEKE